MPTNPFEPPKEVNEPQPPAVGREPWWEPVLAALVIVLLIFWLLLVALNRIDS